MVSLPAALEFMLWGATLILGPFLQAFWTGFLHPTLPSEPSSFSETTLFWPRRSVLLVRVFTLLRATPIKVSTPWSLPALFFHWRAAIQVSIQVRLSLALVLDRDSLTLVLFFLSLSPSPAPSPFFLGWSLPVPWHFPLCSCWSRREAGGPPLSPRGFPAVYSRCYTHFGCW